MPETSVWGQFPIVAIIVLVLGLIGGSSFTAIKWVWGEFKLERDKDQAWRADQNQKREESLREQNLGWQQMVRELADRWDKYDLDRGKVLNALVESNQAMLRKLDEHDDQAKVILNQTARIERYVEPKTEPRNRRAGD